MKKIEKVICSVMVLSCAFKPLSTLAMTKDETVYTTLKQSGELYKTTVVNHLYKTEDEETIHDVTELKDILNINGKEKFTINGRDITWNNQRKEIFYQGSIEKELPIQTEVKYYLNGKEMTSKEMVGKKGNVKIVISLKNIDRHEVEVNGEQETLYTPFVVTAGTILSGKTNSNIEVSNGRVVNTGSKNILVSLATPGLYDSLGMDEFKSMDCITIEYDTTSYKENTIYLVATPKLIDSDDLEVFDQLNFVYQDVDLLQTNMDTIEDGMNRLEEGANQLADGSRELSNHLLEVVSYMKQLENGSLELDQGLQQLIVSLKDAQTQLENGNTKESLTSLRELRLGNDSAIEKLANTNATIKGLFASNGLDIDMVPIEMLPDSLVSYKQTYDGNVSLIGLLQLNNQAIDQTIATTISTNQTIQQLLDQLQTAFLQLETGANTLYSSTSQIRSGIEQLYQGSINLQEGASSLYSGTTTLKTGISTYNQEGIHKLSSYAKASQKITNRLEALTKLSNDYKGFGSDNTDSTTFVSAVK